MARGMGMKMDIKMDMERERGYLSSDVASMVFLASDDEPLEGRLELRVVVHVLERRFPPHVIH